MFVHNVTLHVVSTEAESVSNMTPCERSAARGGRSHGASEPVEAGSCGVLMFGPHRAARIGCSLFPLSRLLFVFYLLPVSPFLRHVYLLLSACLLPLFCIFSTSLLPVCHIFAACFQPVLPLMLLFGGVELIQHGVSLCRRSDKHHAALGLIRTVSAAAADPAHRPDVRQDAAGCPAGREPRFLLHVCLCLLS